MGTRWPSLGWPLGQGSPIGQGSPTRLWPEEESEPAPPPPPTPMAALPMAAAPLQRVHDAVSDEDDELRLGDIDISFDIEVDS